MAPRARPFALAALLVFPAFARAQSEADARARIGALKDRFPPAAQKPSEAAPADPAKYRASADAIAKAGIPISVLIDGSDAGMGWTATNVADFGPAIAAAGGAVKTLHLKYPSAVADAYGSGTMTNIEDTFKLFGGGNLERGCLSHQAVTFGAVKPALANSSLEVKKIRIGTVLPHNAVIVFPKGGDWKKAGVVFDGWLRQKSEPDKMTYLFRKWIGFGGRPRLLGDDE
jgi:hypothetical protein